MSLWENRKTSAIEKEKAAQRLDCFLSVVYLFPNCLEVKDMELLAKRDKELTQIYKYTGRGFFCAYWMTALGYFAFRRGTTPHFSEMMKHTVLSVGGTFVVSSGVEKVAAEMYHNKILIGLSDKYNFTPEEVMDLQRNLNQYYI